jgi:hypothetical protein
VPRKFTAPLLIVTCFLAACANPARTYVGQHPGLSPEHRKIMLAGKVPDGNAVAGMTKEEVRLAMGADPDQFTKIDGQDAWVYLYYTGGGASVSENDRHHSHHRSQPESGDNSGNSGNGAGSNSSSGSDFSFSPPSTNTSDQPSPNASLASKRHLSPITTIFFNGDHAVRAEITRD